MRTSFKEGMSVYDQVNFPNQKGRVIQIDRDLDEYWQVRVIFSGEDYFYNLEGSYGESSIPTLSTKPYKVELKGFEQKVLVPDFEEALDWLDSNENYQTIFEDERTYISKEICDASESLRKLIIQREYYNEGWTPDWKGKDPKYTIENCECELFTDTFFNFSKVMAFKSEKIRDLFLEEQRELLEIAKPLL